MKKLETMIEIKGKKFLFKVDKSHHHSDYAKYEKLRNEIWDEPDDNLSGTRNMMCENFFHDGSSLFISVYVENERGRFIEDKEHFVGFSYGFVGVKNKDIAFRSAENLQFYSQYTGVKENFYKYGLGVLIKEFQKKILVEEFGIYASTCTYDPLTGVNAYRNIHLFGMEVIEYREAHYWDFGGKLNRLDVPCDRMVLSWDLKKEGQKLEYDLKLLIDSNHLVNSSEMTEIAGKNGSVMLEIAAKPNVELDHKYLLVEIPFDFYIMLQETDVDDTKIRKIPLDWRLTTREAFQILFKRGYRIIDFRYFEMEDRKRDFYVLKKN